MSRVPVTAYAFLGKRYGDGMRATASVTFQVTRLLADGIRLFATAIGGVVVVVALLGAVPSGWFGDALDASKFQAFDFSSDALTGGFPFVAAQKALIASGVGLGNKDELFAHYIVTELPTGLSGFAIAGILAAALSSSLGALASATVTDEQRLRLGRIWTIVWAGLLIVCAGLFATANSTTADPIVVQALGITGYTYGALLGAFLLGLIFRRAGRGGPDVDDLVVHPAGCDRDPGGGWPAVDASPRRLISCSMVSNGAAPVRSQGESDTIGRSP